MIICRYICFLSLLFLALCSLGQDLRPDAYFSEFFPVQIDGQNLEREFTQGRSWVYSDGDRISLVVEVKDPDIRSFQSPAYSDHIQVWIGLDETAFPPSFPLATHPFYVGGLHKKPGQRAAEDPGVSLRVFSPQTRTRNISGNWQESAEYPRNLTDSSLVPPASRLREISVPYGMIHLAFFPDERNVQLLDRESYRYLEMSFDRTIGDWLSRIRYDVDTLEYGEGYVISVDIPVEALGFSRMPKIYGLKMMVGIADTDVSGRQARIVSFSQPGISTPSLGEMERISFQNPLTFNPSDIPDEIFDQIGWYPTLFLSSEGWTAVSAEMGYMVPGYRTVLQDWYEIAFREASLKYEDFQDRGFPVQRLSVGFDAVNSPDIVTDYLLIDGNLETVSRARNILPGPAVIPEVDVFRFPDGATGVFVRDNFPFNPYGWGDCGICLQERMRILRTSSGKVVTVASWTQSEGPESGLWIGKETFPEYYLGRMDRLRGGDIIVLVLNHRTLRLQKRVKLTWDQDEFIYQVQVEP